MSSSGLLSALERVLPEWVLCDWHAPGAMQECNARLTSVQLSSIDDLTSTCTCFALCMSMRDWRMCIIAQLINVNNQSTI